MAGLPHRPAASPAMRSLLAEVGVAASHRRLGYGEYEPELAPGENRHAVSAYTACFRFLRAVRKRYPEVLQDLASFPLERVPELAHEGDAIEWVREWAKRQGRGLRADVVIRVAVWTLHQWARNPRARAKRNWNFDLVEWIVPGSRLPKIFPDPFRETRASWMKRCERLWRERVREMMGAGCSQTRAKDQQHFDWLAQYVVGRKTFGQIRLAAGASSEQTIADAVHRLATMIGLNLIKSPSTTREKSLAKKQPRHRS